MLKKRKCEDVGQVCGTAENEAPAVWDCMRFLLWLCPSTHKSQCLFTLLCRCCWVRGEVTGPSPPRWWAILSVALKAHRDASTKRPSQRNPFCPGLVVRKMLCKPFLVFTLPLSQPLDCFRYGTIVGFLGKGISR